MIPFDLELFRIFNAWAHAHPILDAAIIFFARYFPYLVAALPVLIIFTAKRKTAEEIFAKRVIQIYAAALVARFVATPVIRYLWPVERPFAALSDAIQLIPHEASASFPSGHAAFFFAISTSIWFYDRRLGVLFFAASAAISIARIIAGVHWPSDILAGAILGMVASYVFSQASKKRASFG